VADMLAFYRLRCDHSFLIWPHSLSAVHDSSDVAVGYRRYSTGHFNPVPSHATPDAEGLAPGEHGVARVA
jgi:hypothetical protein